MPSKEHHKKYKLTGRNVCPFHRYSTDIKIACEGYDSNCVTVLKWHSKDPHAKKEAWQHKYCENNCRACPYYKSLDKIYNDR